MKQVYLLLGVCVLSVAAGAQSVDRCQAFNYFLASDSVRNLLAFDNNKVTWMYDESEKQVQPDCNCGYNGNRSFKWANDSVMARVARSKNCAYYYASCTRKGSGWQIAIRQACSGLVCQGYISGTKQRLTASSFMAFVR